MRKDELEQLRKEIEPPAPAEPAAEPTGDPETPVAVGEPVAVTRDQLAGIFSGGVIAISVPLCRRARVTTLEPDEVQRMALALADLASAYGLDKIGDPKIAALFVVGSTALSIVAARKKLPDMSPAKPADAPAADKVDPPPAAPSDDTAKYLRGGAG